MHPYHRPAHRRALRAQAHFVTSVISTLSPNAAAVHTTEVPPLAEQFISRPIAYSGGSPVYRCSVDVKVSYVRRRMQTVLADQFV